MSVVKFENIEVGQVYVTRGGIVIIDNSGKTMGWGYDRVKVIKKSATKMIVQTPWGTECVLSSGYPLSKTKETEIHYEFKLITTYISKQEMPFDEAVKRGICIEEGDQPYTKVYSGGATYTDKFWRELVKYFSTPRLITDASKKFEKSYQKIKYMVDRIEKNNLYLVIRDVDDSGKKTVQITKVESR